MNGQITVFILLVFMLVVSVLAAQYKSALFYACRSDAIRASHLSVDSFLALYQKPLKEYYGILAVDGGFGQEVFNQEKIENEILRVFKLNLQSSMTKNFFDTAYLAANPIFTYFIDDDWEFFVREITMGTQENIIIEGAEYILNQWKAQNDLAKDEFEYQKNTAENIEIEKEQSGQEEINKSEVTVQDPRDLIMMLWNQGILKASCPKGFQVSEKKVSMSDVSYPENEETVGISLDLKNDTGIQNLLSNWESMLQTEQYMRLLTEDFWVQNYIKDKFSNAVRLNEKMDNWEKPLNYEMEYIIGGHERDNENLKTVLWKLLAIRCVFNFSYLLLSPQKSNQVMSTAITLSSAFMLPHFTEVFAFALKLSWAFAESLADCRTLLKGGKIPMVKNDMTWYLNWSDVLGFYEEKLDGNTCQEGLDYESYLQILLAFTEKETKYRRMTHLIEKNIRQISGYTGFQMKNCVYGIQAVFGCELAGFGDYEFQTALSY